MIVPHENIATRSLNMRASLGESPIASSTHLFWVDVNRGELYRLDFSTPEAEPTKWKFAEKIGCVALSEQPDTVIIALDNVIYSFNTVSSEREIISKANFDSSQLRFNDGRCDSVGRLWIGTYDKKELSRGGLYCLDLDGTLKQRLRDVAISNGLAWSPDGCTMYHTDTATQIIYAYSYDTTTGQLSRKRTFVDLTSRGEFPDGAAVDISGNYWVAMYGGGKVVQFSATGQLLKEIYVPVANPTMPAFGGTDRRTLYITSASQGYTSADFVQYPQAGSLFATRVPTPGLPESVCRVKRY